jgi:hypothetical protein
MSLLKKVKEIRDYELNTWNLIREDSNKIFAAQQTSLLK